MSKKNDIRKVGFIAALSQICGKSFNGFKNFARCELLWLERIEVIGSFWHHSSNRAIDEDESKAC